MRELLVFVHVPKTAGSTLNRILSEWGPGHAHLEGLVADKERLTKVVDDADWVSSHLPLPRVTAELRAVSARPLRLVTMVRDPFAQVASHYNWLIEIFYRGKKFYDPHPEAIKVISSGIRDSDNGDPASVIAQLTKARGLFMNLQSRIAIGTDASNWGSERIASVLGEYALFTTDEHVQILAERLTGVRLKTEIKENSSPYHFDKAVFETQELREFLLRENRSDIALYNEVRDRGLR